MKATYTLVALVAFFSVTVLAAPVENSVASSEAAQDECGFCDPFGLLCPQHTLTELPSSLVPPYPPRIMLRPTGCPLPDPLIPSLQGTSSHVWPVTSQSGGFC
ncbi:hypothetical protein D9756_006322 [Leucocoprinus leucothites]|uniref:Secreted protein n=1 Tax=Leucocoprinus leucothites TaxID=201217 RepID=A0A8H5D3E1_9AGAR|nr:hypothetical protein D9756_006322 [Leucoagaricus leucothites]